MNNSTKNPGDLARRMGAGRRASATKSSDTWRRESFTLPRLEARVKARELFNKFPKAAYMTEIEFWRETANGDIEFTMRRLPSAD